MTEATWACQCSFYDVWMNLSEYEKYGIIMLGVIVFFMIVDRR